jgi:hypothetical protein
VNFLPSFHTLRCNLSFLALAALLPVAVQASAISFDNQSSWAGALDGADVTVLNFMGPLETHGALVGTAALDAYYTGLGVDFKPFAGTSAYPLILRGQQYQISTPGRDGLLTNLSSPNVGTAGRAILFDFTIPVRAVGAFSNNIDYGLLEAYDEYGALLGSIGIGTNGSGGFGGLFTDSLISHVKLINTYNADLTWGIYDLQFSAGSVPERTQTVPETGTPLVLLGGSLATLVAVRNTRGFRRK